MATAYRIRDWDQHFETSESRKRKSLSWVCVPTKHDGKTFRRLVRKPCAAEIYGAWILILAVAAKCPVRGLLVDNDGPLTAEGLQDKTGIDSSVFSLALQTLTGPDIGWIESVELDETPGTHRQTLPQTAGTPVNTGPTGPDRTGHYRTLPPETGKTPGVGRNDWKAPSTAALRDTQQLLTWLDSEGRKAGLPGTPEVKTRVFAAAERSLEFADNKPRFFAALIRDGLRGDWSKLTGAQLDRAKQRLRGTDDTNGFAANLAATLGGNDADNEKT